LWAFCWPNGNITNNPPNCISRYAPVPIITRKCVPRQTSKGIKYQTFSRIALAGMWFSLCLSLFEVWMVRRCMKSLSLSTPKLPLVSWHQTATRNYGERMCWNGNLNDGYRLYLTTWQQHTFLVSTPICKPMKPVETPLQCFNNLRL
jgi:hypothetical protein